jgi:hypothetical protein
VIRRLAANQITTRRAGEILTVFDNMSRNSPPASPDNFIPK